ncbi:MAG: DUF2156 domain-containing protein [Nitrospirae bacterium]|nr:MAG: DUF2156 domain-containing protein [Nitrospirota bacterium]
MDFALRPLTLGERPQLERAIAEMTPCERSPLAHWAFAPHFIWQGALNYCWTVLDGWWCIFADCADGLYMPLPPVGAWPRGVPDVAESWKKTVVRAMEYLRHRNGGSSVTRIDNIPEELLPHFESLGYRLTLKDPDYCYRTADLAALRGQAFKSQRAACNRLSRTHRVHYVPYRRDDREACLAVLDRWILQKRQSLASSNPDMNAGAVDMLGDAARAHRVALEYDDALGLVGRVVRVDGVIAGYTFGFERSSDVFCVLLEVADRTITGLAQFLFRELCREMQRYPLLNTMDDAGLSRLAASKRLYRPCRLVPAYVATYSDS